MLSISTVSTVDPLQRSYTILARAQAILGAALALGVFALYSWRPSLLADPGASLVVATLGLIGLLYYLGLHWLISKWSLAISTLILTLITGANLIFIIATTGGLDSPYYAFWLLAIVAAGIFGTIDTLVVLGLTIGFFIYALAQNDFSWGYAHSHLPQLVMSLLAGALAEWIYWRTQRTRAQTTTVASLSGRLSEAQLKAQVLLDAMGEGAIVVDNRRRIQLFNPAAATLTGWDEASAAGIDYVVVLNLHTATDGALDQETDPASQAWQSGQSITSDTLVMTSRSGQKLPLYISASPIHNEEGEVTGAVVIFRDIAREKDIERQKDEFISTASHEMRTPVAAIEGYVSLAMNPNVATIDDRAKNFLNKAHESIGHLGRLFGDLLSVTKAEQGLTATTLEPVNLTELLVSTTDDMTFAAKEKQLELSFQPSAGEKKINPVFWVLANPERLREVVMNLLENAIKYTPKGSITVTMVGEKDQVTVSVVDTGVGIPAEDISHLFQKFYRVDSSATRTIGGTGLGLYLGRKLIELFGGRIWVESVYGKGSSFRFTLPVISATEAAQRQQAAKRQVLPDASKPEKPVVPPTPSPKPIAPATTDNNNTAPPPAAKKPAAFDTISKPATPVGPKPPIAKA